MAHERIALKRCHHAEPLPHGMKHLHENTEIKANAGIAFQPIHRAEHIKRKIKQNRADKHRRADSTMQPKIISLFFKRKQKMQRNAEQRRIQRIQRRGKFTPKGNCPVEKQGAEQDGGAKHPVFPAAAEKAEKRKAKHGAKNHRKQIFCRRNRRAAQAPDRKRCKKAQRHAPEDALLLSLCLHVLSPCAKNFLLAL